MAREVILAGSLSKTYDIGMQSITALDDVSISINPGDFITIQGPSGCGKTTLLNLLGLMDVPTSGSVVIDGKDTKSMNGREKARLRNNIGFVFQFYNLLPELTAQENVALPLAVKNVPVKERMDKAAKTLERVGLGHRLKNTPDELSGGEQQRVAIARALIVDPWLIIADEPTGDLDTKTGNEIISLFKELNENEKYTFLIVTHNPVIGEIGKRRVYMSDGKIIDEKSGA